MKQGVNSNNDNSILRVLTMARIVRGKGAELVVETTPFLSDNIKIDIAGNGPLLDALKSRITLLKQNEKVKFHGWVTGEEKQRLIKSANIFCHPTQLDAMPMSILEAMANGLPIVALNWGPIPDLVPDNKAGLLVADADPVKIAIAIEKLKDKSLRLEMGRAGQEWVLENYTAQRVGLTLASIFEKMVQK